MSYNEYIDPEFRFDEPDERDWIYEPVDTALPSSVDLRAYTGEIENQGQTGSCVANATVSALEVMFNKKGTTKDLSRLFVYWFLRLPYASLRGRDTGAYTRDGFKTVNKHGVCSENTWKFIIGNINKEPSEEAKAEAFSTRCYGYYRLSTSYQVKQVLSAGYPVLISMYITSKLSSRYIRGNLKNHNYRGRLDESSTTRGGHAMVAVGYDDALNGFIVENSWSSYFGDNGYFLLDYNVFDNDVKDMWYVTNVVDNYTEPKKEDPKPEPKKDDPKPKPKPNNVVEELSIVERIINWFKDIISRFK